MADADQSDLTSLTVQLLSAYVANNQVPSSELAVLIQTTRSALAVPPEPEIATVPEYQPAVSVRKSLGSKDHILSLIDGRPYKTLKRHLANHGLTPAEYRDRYALPKDYPLVAPSYSERRREVARALGLGRGGVSRKAAEAPAADPAPAAVAPTTEPAAATSAKPRRAAKPKPAIESASKPASKRSTKAVLAPESVVAEPPAEGIAATETPKRRGRKPAAMASATPVEASTPKRGTKRLATPETVEVVPSASPRARKKAASA